MATATAARRNVKELTATLADIKKGARVRAVFLTPRYGHFEVTGTVIKGGAGQDREQLIVAGWLLNAKDRPGKHLQELELLAVAGDHEYPIEPSAAPEHVGIG